MSDEGAWAASVRWSGETPDPWAFFCPNSDDAVAKGMELGSDGPIAERNTPDIVGYGALRPLCLLAGMGQTACSDPASFGRRTSP